MSEIILTKEIAEQLKNTSQIYADWYGNWGQGEFNYLVIDKNGKSTVCGDELKNLINGIIDKNECFHTRHEIGSLGYFRWNLDTNEVRWHTEPKTPEAELQICLWDCIYKDIHKLSCKLNGVKDEDEQIDYIKISERKWDYISHNSHLNTNIVISQVYIKSQLKSNKSGTDFKDAWLFKDHQKCLSNALGDIILDYIDNEYFYYDKSDELSKLILSGCNLIVKPFDNMIQLKSNKDDFLKIEIISNLFQPQFINPTIEI